MLPGRPAGVCRRRVRPDTLTCGRTRPTDDDPALGICPGRDRQRPHHQASTSSGGHDAGEQARRDRQGGVPQVARTTRPTTVARPSQLHPAPARPPGRHSQPPPPAQQPPTRSRRRSLPRRRCDPLQPPWRPVAGRSPRRRRPGRPGVGRWPPQPPAGRACNRSTRRPTGAVEPGARRPLRFPRLWRRVPLRVPRP